MSNETVFCVPPPRTYRGATVMTRVEADLYAQVAAIGDKCRLSYTQVLNTILRDGLKRVRLVEVPLYEMRMEGGDQDGGQTAPL